MIKKLLFLVIASSIALTSCTETPFVPNSTNNTMVGEWTIVEVDNADALVSGTELMTSLLNEKFLPSNVLVFEEGANFTLNNKEGKTGFKGQYSLGEKISPVTLLIDGVQYEYKTEGDNAGLWLNSNTAGETVKIKIAKK